MQPSTLSAFEREELDQAELWSVARAKATEILQGHYAPSERFQKVDIHELSIIPSLAMQLKNLRSPREMLMEFIQFQENGLIPDMVEKGEDPDGPLDACGKPLRIRLARRVQTGMDQEASLVVAVSSYIHNSGDLQFLNENVHGKKVIKHLFDVMGWFWQSCYSQTDGLLLPRLERQGEIAGIREHAWVLCALQEMLHLPGVSGFVQKTWSLRQRKLAEAFQQRFWDESRGKYLPVGKGVATGEGFEFDPFGTALAVRAGLLTPEERGRSLCATLALLEAWGASAGWEAQVAAIYAKAGYQVQAMEMLRNVALQLKNGEVKGQGNDPSGGRPQAGVYSLDAPSKYAIAACFLEANKHLHPLVRQAPISENWEKPLSTSSFGHPTRPKYSFQKIEYEEKREANRAPIELPVEYVLKGLRHRQKHTGVIWHPSSYGMCLITTEAIFEEATLDMIAHCEALGAEKPCRLRGRVRWTRSKVGTRLYQSGVELDARSKDLKQWKAFVVSHLRQQDAE